MENSVERVDVDRIEVDEPAAALFSGGKLCLRLCCADPEVVSDARGITVTGAVSAWTLVGDELSLEFNNHAQSALGLPRVQLFSLRVTEAEIVTLRDALLEILESACCVIDTPGLKFSQ